MVIKKSIQQACLILLQVFICCQSLAGSNNKITIQEFNDADTGVAWTMMSKHAWLQRDVTMFHDDPSTPQKVLQAVTISNATKKLQPYQADTRYGLLFSLSREAGFYRYFATKSSFGTACPPDNTSMVSPMTHLPASQYSEITHWAVSCSAGGKVEQIALCARCFDGGVCAGAGNIPNTKNKLWPALGDQVSFSSFQKAKNAIVRDSGSMSSCRWATANDIWNEFDTNGLSKDALVGIMIDKTTAAPPNIWTPSDSDICHYLLAVKPERSEWPVYELTFTQSKSSPSKLTNTQVLQCSKPSG